MEAVEYSAANVPVTRGSRMYVFSDGVYEVRLPEGGVMALDDFIPLLSETPSAEAGLLSVREQVAEIQGRDRFEDDFSLVEIVFP